MASDPTALCKKDPGTGAHEVCPANELVTHVHVTTLEGKLGILLGMVEVKCDVLFLGDVKSEKT